MHRRSTSFKKADNQLNPWLSIWTKPRATMRQVLETDPARLVLVLAMLGGLSQALATTVIAGLLVILPIALVVMIVDGFIR